MLYLTTLALAAAPPPIVNGEVTTDYPEVLALYLSDQSGRQGALCTASLISPRWVLTAAHCVTDSADFELAYIYVMFVNETNEADQGNTKLAKAWYPNPNYSAQTGLNDIALIEMRTDMDGPFMPLTDTGIRRSDVDTDFRIVGFGATSDRDNSTNSKKRVVDVPLVDYDNSLMHTEDKADDQNACHGDSGGPVMRLYDDGTYAVAGIVDFGGPSCSRDGTYSARVDNFMPFIDEYVDDYTIWSAAEEPDPEPEDTGGGGGSGEGEDTDDRVALDSSEPTTPGFCGTPTAAGFGAAALAGLLAARRRRQG
jgi:MYXO-CTERM domain-containing protein